MEVVGVFAISTDWKFEGEDFLISLLDKLGQFVGILFCNFKLRFSKLTFGIGLDEFDTA